MLFDNSRPYRMVFQARNDVLVMGVPEKQLRRYMSCPEDVVAIAMPYKVNLNRLLSDTAQGLWRQCQEGMTNAVASMLTRAFLELTASAYSAIPSARAHRSSMGGVRRTQILNHIERHLTEHDLTPSRIAFEMNVTPRYLHLLFAGGQETIARYILRRRLEECARALAGDFGAARSVSEIAFDYGFGSLTHFGKVFREKYGLTPTEYRHRCATESERPVTSAPGSG
jgi:AraC-like DNA-binding protein